MDMTSFEFEDYLNGNMPDSERRALEQRLANDPVLQEQLKEEEELLARLKKQMLRERVEAAMKAGRGNIQPTPSRWWIWAAMAVLLAVMMARWTFGGDEVSEEEPIQEQPVSPKAEEALPAEALPPGAPPPGPVAQRTEPSPAEENPQSGLRGLGDAPSAGLGKDAVRQFQITGAAFSLIFQPAVEQARKGRYREAGEALAELEQQGASSDTLAYLRAFCLLKLENGMEAARYFARLETQAGPFAEEAQWGLALSWLLAGQEAWAEEQLQAITGQREHPRAATAAALLEKLAADRQ